MQILKVLEFVDENGGQVLTLGSFTLLPQHVVRLILTRDELRADELTKFHVSIFLVKITYKDHVLGVLTNDIVDIILS